MRPQRKHSLSVLPFPPPFVLLLLESCRDLVKTFLAVSDLQTVQFSIFTFHGFVTTGMVVVVFIAQFSHHHWSKTVCATVDDCCDASFHVRLIWEQVLLWLSTLSQDLWGT